MAAIRPVVLVFQEFGTPTITPTTPDLNCLVVGPAYHIQDYYAPGTTDYADKASIGLATAYGALEAPVGTALPVGTGVIEVADPPNNVVGALLDASSVAVYFDQARVVITEGTLGVTDADTPNTFVVTDVVDFTTGATKVLRGDRVILLDADDNSLVRTVYTVVDATTLTFTQDIPGTDWTVGACEWRIERQVNDALIDASFYSVNDNAISINGGITLTVSTQGAKYVSYAKAYIAYRSLRQDLQELATVLTTDEIEGQIGRLDVRNPLACGVFVARQNTTSRVQYLGVGSNDLVGYTSARDTLASRPDVYAIMPLTANPSILAMWNTDCVGLALADEVRGRPQRFRVVIGSGTLPITKTLIDPLTTGQSVVKATTAPVAVCQITVTGASFVTENIVPGDVLVIAADTAVGGTACNGNYTISAVISATVLEVDTAFPSAKAFELDAGFTKATFTIGTKHATATATGATTAAKGDLYLVLKDDAGTFLSSGLMAGDIVQMPLDPASSDFTGTLTSFVVSTVLSENRLEIVNNGRDTSTAQNELPHGVKRIGGALVPTTATLNYQIVRTLSKDGQVTQLVALAQSFRSRRTVLVWPDLVDVAGVVGGNNQPGYYLACAVGGMTAGLPPHQGFTFLGIAGVSRIYHSNTYFKDDHLTDLSNGGWYVFAQQTPSALPYTIHQLTTDTSTLESGEFSVVKNFDFVSLYFVDILSEFLGIYNITTDTLVLIREALNIGGETLRLRTYAKIGAPLTAFSIVDLGVSPVSADRVVTHISVGLPKPLNNIELHLVA